MDSNLRNIQTLEALEKNPKSDDRALDSKQESDFVLIAMNRKRDRSPSTSAEESTTKMCLVLGAAFGGGDSQSYVYAIILDPNLQTDAGDTVFDQDDFILNAQPTVRFDGLDGVSLAFCVSKSTLYMIESNLETPSETFYEHMLRNPLLQRLDENTERAIIGEIPMTKTVYTFELAQANSSSKMVVVEKSELQKLPDMLGGKVQAEALVTPRGKILVYSKHISYDFTYSSNLSEFELYDPDTQEWIKLPRLYNPPPSDVYDKGMRIVGSGFLSSSVLFISTSHGNYVIDVEENEKCWKKHKLYNERIEENFYFLGEEGMCLTLGGVKSTKDWGRVCESPPPSRFPAHIIDSAIRTKGLYSGITRSIGLLDDVDGGGRFRFCSVQVVYYKEGGIAIPFFILDVFNVNSKLITSKASLLRFSLDVFNVNNKLITSKERLLRFSPRHLGNLYLLMNFGLFRVQFST